MIENVEIDGEVQIAGIFSLYFEYQILVDRKGNAELVLLLISFGISAARTKKKSSMTITLNKKFVQYKGKMY